MTETRRTWQASDHRRVAGRYDLVGLNGSLLPAGVEDEVAGGSHDSAAVTRMSLVHRTRVPWGRRRGPDLTWVYIR